MSETGSNNLTENTGSSGLERYLSPISAWALSFGCSVGWGAFVMPGTTFLPKAGPIGTVIGMVIGAIIMWIIGYNYHYLINKYPGAGGTLTYTTQAFGYDHGFLSSWFLILVYVAIIWANATAIALIGRSLFGNMLQFGFHYRVLDYEVYMGEVLITMAAIILAGILCTKAKKVAVSLQVLLAIILFGGIVACFVSALAGGGITPGEMKPAFVPADTIKAGQIFTIIALSPWAYVGFEAISNSAEGFNFPAQKTICILTASLVTGALSYSLLAIFAASGTPEGYSDWSDYVKAIGSLHGIQGLPTFNFVNISLGRIGTIVLGLAALAAILTGLIGNYVAASRLMYSMAREEILPPWFGRLNENATPQNALTFLMVISCLVPFLGRTALGWIVDVNTVGATIAYGYTSAAAFVSARRDNNKKVIVTSIAGLVMSVFFFFYFMAISAGAMSTESYLILAGWSILGFVYFRWVFSRDTKKHFGKSTVVWIGLVFLIFFTTLMWVKQSTDDMTKSVVTNIREYYEEKNTDTDPDAMAETEEYLEEQMMMANHNMTRNSVIQMILIMISLGIMFSVYTTISRREKQSEIEKVAAEESNRAKTVFLSNMSHDIRTPMNAIIGYINLADRDDITLPEIKEFLGKIKGSSHHLLALINDVLEMSRIESGKMELEPIAVDLKQTLGEVRDLFSTQMSEKNIDFTVDSSQIKHSAVYCDKNWLNRVLLNLVSNAYKFTPEGGRVSVTVWEISKDTPEEGHYEIRVADSGIGMSEEFAAKVFEAFERERTSTVSGIQGTGLGMSIAKSLIDMMGGEITVNTAPGNGSEFVIHVSFKLQDEQTKLPGDTGSRGSFGTGSIAGASMVSNDERDMQERGIDDTSGDISDTGDSPGYGDDNMNEDPQVIFEGKRLLLAEDILINREIASMQLSSLGFVLEYAENGQEAVEMVTASEPGYYDAVLMDIQMPIMNGYEATEAIRALDNRELSRLPIVAMTANAFSEDVKKAHDAGMNAHVAKPINMDLLESVLRDALSGRL